MINRTQNIRGKQRKTHSNIVKKTLYKILLSQKKTAKDRQKQHKHKQENKRDKTEEKKRERERTEKKTRICTKIKNGIYISIPRRKKKCFLYHLIYH